MEDYNYMDHDYLKDCSCRVQPCAEYAPKPELLQTDLPDPNVYPIVWCRNCVHSGRYIDNWGRDWCHCETFNVNMHPSSVCWFCSAKGRDREEENE